MEAPSPRSCFGDAYACSFDGELSDQLLLKVIHFDQTFEK